VNPKTPLDQVEQSLAIVLDDIRLRRKMEEDKLKRGKRNL